MTKILPAPLRQVEGKGKNLEEYFLNADDIHADDKYITNGPCLVSKSILKSGVLRLVKNMDNIWEPIKDLVPYEKGNEYDCISVGTKCELQPYYKIGIIYNETYSFDYDYISMLIKHIPYWDVPSFYVIKNSDGTPILKIFNSNDEFIALLMPIKKEVE